MQFFTVFLHGKAGWGGIMPIVFQKSIVVDFVLKITPIPELEQKRKIGERFPKTRLAYEAGSEGFLTLANRS